jgi:hypothetical protein
MKKSTSTTAEYGSRAHRRAEAMACHEIEGNPLTRDDILMFEMFDREGWSDDQRIAHIAQLAQQDSENILAAE